MQEVIPKNPCSCWFVDNDRMKEICTESFTIYHFVISLSVTILFAPHSLETISKLFPILFLSRWQGILKSCKWNANLVKILFFLLYMCSHHTNSPSSFSSVIPSPSKPTKSDHHPNAVYFGCGTTTNSSPWAYQDKTRSPDCYPSVDNKLDHVGNHHSGNSESGEGPCATELLRNNSMDPCATVLSPTLHFPQVFCCRHTRRNLEKFIHSQVHPSCDWSINILYLCHHHSFYPKNNTILQNYIPWQTTTKTNKNAYWNIYVQSIQHIEKLCTSI